MYCNTHSFHFMYDLEGLIMYVNAYSSVSTKFYSIFNKEKNEMGGWSFLYLKECVCSHLLPLRAPAGTVLLMARTPSDGWLIGTESQVTSRSQEMRLDYKTETLSSSSSIVTVMFSLPEASWLITLTQFLCLQNSLWYLPCRWLKGKDKMKYLGLYFPFLKPLKPPFIV